jgi:transcriptional regulator with GAF, ATPase, and Fis domain
MESDDCAEDGENFDLPIEWAQCLLLDLARERPLDGLLERIVARFAELPDLALARVWVVRPGDSCENCSMRDQCARNIDCLHLVASRGREPREVGADWSRLNGDFRRFPFGVRKIGLIAEKGEAVWIEDIRENAEWIARPDWAGSEGIIGFGGQPLIHHGEILGVLGVFTRRRFCRVSLAALRVIADHAAAALANARAFEEIDALRARLALENEYLRDEIDEAQSFGEILGSSQAIRTVGRQVEQVASTDATTLVLGESGTGKELVAREIHRRSLRSDRPLIRVNCASIPKDLFESEFFGHVRGAFTGAVKDRVGRFAAADGGTLFLDEVGEIPLDLQSKLLRVLQEGQFERVGEDRTREVDVRIIGATNVDLEEEVKAGRFREDLYYRLNVFPISVPALRDRSEDIPMLADHFVDCLGKKLNKKVRLTDADRRMLANHVWPGNVRELQNVIERAIILSNDARLHFDLDRVLGGEISGALPKALSAADADVEAQAVRTDAEMRASERENLRAALEQAGGRVSGPGGVADLLGLRPTTVASRLQRLGLK